MFHSLVIFFLLLIFLFSDDLSLEKLLSFCQKLLVMLSRFQRYFTSTQIFLKFRESLVHQGKFFIGADSFQLIGIFLQEPAKLLNCLLVTRKSELEYGQHFAYMPDNFNCSEHTVRNSGKPMKVEKRFIEDVIKNLSIFEFIER